MDEKIVGAGDSGGAFGRERSGSAAKTLDEVQIAERAMGNDQVKPIPFMPEPRRRARPVARAHARATGGALEGRDRVEISMIGAGSGTS